MAEYDLPAMINKVLEVSQASSLFYVGHSMGTTAAFAKFSRDKEFGRKIKTFYALAPGVMYQHVKGPLRLIAPMIEMQYVFFKIFGFNEFLPSNTWMRLFAKYFCGNNPVTELYCQNLLLLTAGPESHQMNHTRVPVYIAHAPAGVSTQTFAHYGQIIMSRKFQMYDYGSSKNKDRYGQVTPPQYDVSQIEVPTYLFWGDDDWLAPPADVEMLIPKLRNVIGKTFLKKFNHLDFVWGLRATEDVYWPIIKNIREQLHC